MIDLKELVHKRANAWEANKALLDKAGGEKRSLTAEEQEQFDRAFKEIEELTETIDRAQRHADSGKKLDERIADPQKPDPNLPPADRKDVRSTPEYEAAFRRFLGAPREEAAQAAEEFRALQADVDTSGGFMVPTDWMAKLIVAVDDAVFIRRLATKFTVTKAESLGCPKLTADPADSDWTTELQIGGEDSTMAVGGRDLHPHPLGKLLKVSNKLIRVSAIGIDALVRDRLGYKFGITEEKAFLLGTGAGQPLGVFVADDQGISTGRDVSTGNDADNVTFDGLLEAQFTLKGNYWPRAAWIFHRGGVKRIAKLKDGEGQYIWRPGLAAREPNRILGFPYYMSEYAPNTWTTGLYVGIVGDFSFYWIADALSMTIQRLVELYAGTNQTGYIGRLECDGAPVLEEAFVRVKLA